MIPFVRNLNAMLDRIPHDVVALVLRIFPADGILSIGSDQGRGAVHH